MFSLSGGDLGNVQKGGHTIPEDWKTLLIGLKSSQIWERQQTCGTKLYLHRLRYSLCHFEVLRHWTQRDENGFNLKSPMCFGDDVTGSYNLASCHFACSEGLHCGVPCCIPWYRCMASYYKMSGWVEAVCNQRLG